MSEADDSLRVTSLDEEFDADMRATVAGPQDPQPSEASSTVLPEVLGYLEREYGLQRLSQAPPAPSEKGPGGWLRKLARKLFVSRTYHASLVGAVAELEARQRASEARVEALLAAQRDYDAVLARTVFKLWGDYNYVVREVIPSLIVSLREGEERATEGFEQLTAAQREQEAKATASLEEITAALRALEGRLGEVEGPVDRTVASVAELIAGLGRETALARRVEALEAREAPADS